MSGTAQLHQLRCVFDSCAFVLRDVCKLWTSGQCPVDFRFLDICSDCFPLVRAGQNRAGTFVARSHRSPPNEFDCHGPSSRGSYRQCITMYSTLACPRHTCRHHPCTHNAWCLRRLGPELSSCCLAAASVFKVEHRLFERCETGH